MENSDASFTREIVNGGEVLIPSILTAENIERMGHIDGAPGFAAGVLQKVPELLRSVSLDPANLTLALYDGGGKRSWGHVILARCSRGWQRVQLETSSCTACGWQGLTANPALIELYYGTDNEESEYRGAFNLARLRCPRCNAKLPSYAIWIDPNAV